MDDHKANGLSSPTVPVIKYAPEKLLIKSSIDFDIENKVYEINDCEIDPSVAETFRTPDGNIRITQHGLNELGNQMVHDNLHIVKTYLQKTTSDQNVSPDRRAEAFEEMLEEQEKFGALMLTVKNLHAAILQTMKASMTEDHVVSLSDSIAEVASRKVHSPDDEHEHINEESAHEMDNEHEYIYERKSYETDDISKDIDLAEFTRPMSLLYEDENYLEIKKSLPEKGEKYDKKSSRRFLTLTWMNYRFIQDDVLFFYAPDLKFPNINDDHVRCPPFILGDDRTPPEFLRDYRDKIGRYLEKEIWKISRFARLLERCSETEYIVEIIKRYLRACTAKKMKPTFARVEQLFLKETWSKPDQELLEREFHALNLESDGWEEAVEFVVQWQRQLRDLALGNIENPIESIFQKLPAEFKTWFNIHYRKDSSDLTDHVVLCSSLRRYSKYFLASLRSHDL